MFPTLVTGPIKTGSNSLNMRETIKASLPWSPKNCTVSLLLYMRKNAPTSTAITTSQWSGFKDCIVRKIDWGANNRKTDDKVQPSASVSVEIFFLKPLVIRPRVGSFKDMEYLYNTCSAAGFLFQINFVYAKKFQNMPMIMPSMA